MARHGIKKRAILYWSDRFFGRRALHWPLGILQFVYVALFTGSRWSRPYSGITLIACRPLGLDTLSPIADALDLLHRVDLRRLKRVERHIKCILLGNFKQYAFYDSLGRICGLRRRPDPDHSSPLAVYGYAASIIHEATHAFLDRKRFAPTKANLKRIERIYMREEARFLSKFPGLRDRLALVFGYTEKKPKTVGERQPKASRGPPI